MSELEFNDKLEFEIDIYNSRQRLFEWYEEELELNPNFEGIIALNYRKVGLSIGKTNIMSIEE